MVTNEYYIKEYIKTRGLKHKTYLTMKYILNHYSDYQKMSLHELLLEADIEEEKRVRWKKRTLKRRLINYMNYLKSNMELKSAKSYFSRVKSFYTHNEIEIGKLPNWNIKNMNLKPPIKPSDLPTKEIIKQAVDISPPLMKALILVLVSSGMSKIDVLSLTIGDYLKSTYPYHKSDNIQLAIKIMLKSEIDILPLFEMRRTKNNKFFMTYISPEANNEICNYLLIRDKRNKKYHRPLLQKCDKLFKISSNTYQDKFIEINNALKLGKVGNYNRFRGHMLRKFHASQLEKYGMSRENIRILQGKSNGAVDDVYFYTDAETLKKEYLKAIEGILILSEVNKVNEYSEEYQLLLEENKKLKEQNKRIKQLEDDILNIKSWYKFGE